jgi:hypothetical protein
VGQTFLSALSLRDFDELSRVVRDIPVPQSKLEWLAKDKNVLRSPFEADKNVGSTVSQ